MENVLTRPRPAVAFRPPTKPRVEPAEALAAVRRGWRQVLAATLLGVAAAAFAVIWLSDGFVAVGSVRIREADRVAIDVDLIRSPEFARKVVARSGLRVFGPELKEPATNVTVTRVTLTPGAMDRVRLRLGEGQVTGQMGDIEAVAPYGEALWFPDVEFALNAPPETAMDSLVIVPEELALDWLSAGWSSAVDGSRIEVRMRSSSASLALRVVDAALTEVAAMHAGGMAQLSEVRRPTSAQPVRVGTFRVLALGLLAGLTIGLGVILVRWRIDPRLRRRVEVEHYLQIPGVAIIPSLRTLSGANPATTTARHDLYAPLCSRLLQPGDEASPRCVVVTSAQRGAGTTTTAANLAAALAEKGRRVLLIDCDMHTPTLHERFDAKCEPGLSELLLDRVDLQDAFRQTGTRNLYLLPAGTLPAQPTVLLTSKRFSAMLASLAMLFEIVIIDAPPMLAATDASLLAGMTDGVLLVVRAGATDRDAAQEAVRQLDVARAHVIGAVLNDANGTAAQYGLN